MMAASGDNQDLVIRNGRPADAEDLARLAVLAGHGLLDIFYGGLIPGKSTHEIVVERRILWPGGFCEANNWRVIEDAGHRLLGGLNSFPHDLFVTATPDPLLSEDRFATVASLTELEAAATGTYYVNMIAVFPERRRAGAGAALMAEAERLARLNGFRRMMLSTYEADGRLVNFYQNQGFEIHATKAIAPHPLLEHSGNWALMVRDLDD